MWFYYIKYIISCFYDYGVFNESCKIKINFCGYIFFKLLIYDNLMFFINLFNVVLIND